MVAAKTFEELYASIYDDLYLGKPYDLEVEFILNQISMATSSDTRSLNMLDFGCGTGNHVLEFSERGYKVTGIDPSPYMIEIAKRKLKDRNNVQFLVGTEEVIPLKDFDLVTCLFNVLGYFSALSKPLNLFEEFHYILSKNQGWLVFDFWDQSKMSTVNAMNSSSFYMTKIGHAERVTSSRFLESDLLEIDIRWEINGTSRLFSNEKHTLRLFDKIQLRNLLISAGFKNILEAYPPSGNYQDKRSSTFIARA
jgi:SAM-dependent methyltransferase